MTLPLAYCYAPMEARSLPSCPQGKEWQYEPKWDGFRCIAFKDGAKIELRSKSGKPLTRYFPEVVESLAALKAPRVRARRRDRRAEWRARSRSTRCCSAFIQPRVASRSSRRETSGAVRRVRSARGREERRSHRTSARRSGGRARRRSSRSTRARDNVESRRRVAGHDAESEWRASGWKVAKGLDGVIAKRLDAAVRVR